MGNLTLTHSPDEHHSAYNDFYWQIASSVNPTPSFAYFTVTLRLPTTTETSTYNLNGSELICQKTSGGITPSIHKNGQVRIQGITYNDVFVVLKELAPGALWVLDSPYIKDETGITAFEELVNYAVYSKLYIDGNYILTDYRQRDADDLFTFDFSNVVQAYVSGQLLDSGTAIGLTGNTNHIKEVYISYYERYEQEDVNGELTVISTETDTETTPVRYAHCSVLDYVWRLNRTIVSENYDLSDFIITSISKSKRFLTEADNIPIGIDEDYQLTCAFNISSLPLGYKYFIEIKQYINGSTTDIDTVFTLPLGHFVKDISCGTKVFTLNSSCWKYTVQLVAVNGGVTSYITEAKTFILNRKCSRSEFRMVWLNELGGYDAFTFRGESLQQSTLDEVKIEKTRPRGRIIGDRSSKMVSSRRQELFVINTGMIDSNTAYWLQQILTSPDVYLEQQGETSIIRLPVNITSKDMDEISSNDTLQNYTLKFALDYTKGGIRG